MANDAKQSGGAGRAGINYIAAQARREARRHGEFASLAEYRRRAAQQILEGAGRNLAEVNRDIAKFGLRSGGFTAMGYRYSPQSMRAAIRLLEKRGEDLE